MWPLPPPYGETDRKISSFFQAFPIKWTNKPLFETWYFAPLFYMKPLFFSNFKSTLNLSSRSPTGQPGPNVRCDSSSKSWRSKNHNIASLWSIINVYICLNVKIRKRKIIICTIVFSLVMRKQREEKIEFACYQLWSKEISSFVLYVLRAMSQISTVLNSLENYQTTESELL